MKVEIRLDSAYTEPLAVIHTAEITDEVSEAVKKLKETKESGSEIITGFNEEQAEIISPDEIYRVYAENQKVLAVTDKGTYRLRMRLYQAEERLAGRKFARISNSEIINLSKTANFDLSFAGTIQVRMKNGDTTFVSRRYVSEIKKILGI
ncbi:MAG: LytTR family transcriptional regulator DNA-binding domain-containing protein [Clostridia bacterium]|nr:LytTR family transcriptional regulator DNA-binding domain-containing protein [Clostridia bacterium]